MREFKRLLLAVLVLTFLGGIGMGAWIGSLSAAGREEIQSVDRRVQDWESHFDLTPSQIRRLRAVILRYDKGVKDIRDELSAEQHQRIRRLGDTCRGEISEILTEEQRREYDKRKGRG